MSALFSLGIKGVWAAQFRGKVPLHTWKDTFPHILSPPMAQPLAFDIGYLAKDPHNICLFGLAQHVWPTPPSMHSSFVSWHVGCSLLCLTGPISFWLPSPLFYCLLLCFGGFGVHLHNSAGSCAIGAG